MLEEMVFQDHNPLITADLQYVIHVFFQGILIEHHTMMFEKGCSCHFSESNQLLTSSNSSFFPNHRTVRNGKWP